MLTLIGVILAAALGGLVVAIGGAKIGIGLIGAWLVVASFFIPLHVTFWVLVIATFVLVGPIQYFARIDKIFWLSYLVGFLLLARAVIATLFTNSGMRAKRRNITSIEVMVILAAIILLASSAMNLSPILQTLLAAKEYFFLWGAWFVLIGGIVGVRSLDRLWAWMPWFLLLQFPAVVYQHFFIATNRAGAASWDAVVGLFGGDPEGGGASGAMAMCAVIAIAFAITHWRRRLMPGWKVFMTGVLGMATIMLAEVKVAIILIPLVIFMIYGAEIFRRPLRSLAMLCAGVIASVAVVAVYQMQFTTTATKSGRSLDAYVIDAIEKNTQVDYVDPLTFQMGRIGALTFWWKEQRVEEPLQLIIGNGIGASRMGLFKGEVAQRYGFDIERSSAAIMLWDAGILGLLALAGALFAGVWRAFRLARQSVVADEAAVLQALGVGLTIVLLTLPYGPDFIRVPQFQLFVILMLARVAISSSPTCSRFKSPVTTSISPKRAYSSSGAAL